MEKNKKMIIVVASLLLVVGVSLAYFTASVLLGGAGANVSGTTATLKNSELKVEGTLEFNDLDIYPGHKTISSIKVTATGNNELVPFNLIWEGTNTINTPLNYTVYKTSSEVEVSITCEKTRGVVDGAYMYYEECIESNLDSLGESISSGTINTNDEKVELVNDEFVTATNDGEIIYYYIILEYPNLDESQNIDIGGVFNGEVTVELSDAKPDINIIAAYIEQEDGSYQEVSDIPQEGYTINTEKSTCSNGATPTGVIPNITINNLTKSGTSCYLYFDEELSAAETILASKSIDDSRSGAITGTLTTNTTGTVYSVQDDDGTSYVYAGAPTDNWVSFAGFYWRIIRINGDGSIRMIYAGTSTSTSNMDTDDQIQTSAYNSSYNDNAYVGYMYGSIGQSNYANTHRNTNNSTIKGILDEWYEENLLDNYADKLSIEAGFCNDRSLNTTSETWWNSDTKLGYGKNATAYGPWGRLFTNNAWKTSQTPSLKCSQSNDLFTISGSSKGNHGLTYPIGLITSDEVVLAGGFGGSNNISYYLYTNQLYWTMSPYIFNASYSYARVFIVSSTGIFADTSVNNVYGVRPVINLSPDVTLSGTGTTSDPYKVV